MLSASVRTHVFQCVQVHSIGELGTSLGIMWLAIRVHHSHPNAEHMGMHYRTTDGTWEPEIARSTARSAQ
jgi:hypothetical protein